MRHYGCWWRVPSSYGLWITEVIYDNQTFGTGAVVGNLDMGMWHTYESTGAVIPFNGGAKTYSDCAR